MVRICVVIVQRYIFAGHYPGLSMSLSRFSPKVLAYFALGLICIIWGTTYTAIKLALPYFPSMLLVGLRQTAAGIIMLGIALLTVRGRFAFQQLTPRYIAVQAITGIFTITGGNGFITWGMQYISSGLASVIGALTPVMVLLINFVWHRRGDRIHWMTILGVLLGFAGLGFIFNHGWGDFTNPDYRWGIAASFASCFTWSLGTVMAKRFNQNQFPPVLNAGLQITAGGAGALLLSMAVDTRHSIDHHWQGWLAAAYLIVIGSALAFTLYMYVLKQLSATAASLYTYINPTIAVFLGWLLLKEPLSLYEVAGMSITLMGVWLVNKGENA